MTAIATLPLLLKLAYISPLRHFPFLDIQLCPRTFFSANQAMALSGLCNILHSAVLAIHDSLVSTIFCSLYYQLSFLTSLPIYSSQTVYAQLCFYRCNVVGLRTFWYHLDCPFLPFIYL